MTWGESPKAQKPEIAVGVWGEAWGIGMTRTADLRALKYCSVVSGGGCQMHPASILCYMLLVLQLLLLLLPLVGAALMYFSAEL